MAMINENYLKLPGSYLFSEIAGRRKAFLAANPNAKLIRLGIGDVTRPLPQESVRAMREAALEMADITSFRGYGPEQGYDFLINKIIEYDYKPRGVKIGPDEVFISDGSKCDVANIQELFGTDNIIAVTDPVYPVYVDSNVMAGRSGKYNAAAGRYEGIMYLPCNAENGFTPSLPVSKADLIYLCLPNNPTGMTLSGDELRKWVDYARTNRSVILYDAAYEAYIREPGIPHSIYEIEGAEEVAIEFRSFSKTAGFTGTRCAFAVVPKKLKAYLSDGSEFSLNKLWNRRQTTKFNGTSYIIQRGAEAVYSPEGQKQVRELINYYMANAAIIKTGLASVGLDVYGGVNAPYIWLKTPGNMDSWAFFDKLLNEAQIEGTPGSGFGPGGQGYFRLTAYGTRENTEEAIVRFKEKLRI